MATRVSCQQGMWTFLCSVVKVGVGASGGQATLSPNVCPWLTQEERAGTLLCSGDSCVMAMGGGGRPGAGQPPPWEPCLRPHSAAPSCLWVPGPLIPLAWAAAAVISFLDPPGPLWLSFPCLQAEKLSLKPSWPLPLLALTGEGLGS